MAGRAPLAATLLLLLLATAAAGAEEPYLFHHVTAMLLVADPDRAAGRIASWAEEQGGYFLLRSNERAVIRFPASQVGRLRAFLEEVAEQVVRFDPRATDLREKLLRVRSQISSREQILQKNLSFIDQAGVEGTLAIEREVMGLLQEIERLKGALRKLEVDRRMALAEVSFRFREQTLPENIPSSFPWINDIDFYMFMQEGIFP